MVRRKLAGRKISNPSGFSVLGSDAWRTWTRMAIGVIFLNARFCPLPSQSAILANHPDHFFGSKSNCSSNAPRNKVTAIQIKTQRQRRRLGDSDARGGDH